jgi:hypothetical protein
MGIAGYVSICVQQGNNKNNEGKQHRNKTQMENMQSVST